MLQLDERATFRRGIQQAAARADHRFGRGHDLFADRINRRVRDLREQLLEIIVEQLRMLRENRERCVRAHRAERLLSVLRHRADDESQILERVTERLLPLQHLAVRDFRAFRRLGQILQQDMMFIQPLLVRLRAGVFLLEFFVGNDAAFDRVHEEHATRLQTALVQHTLRRDGQHARFRRHDDHVVLRHVIPRRTQTVTIQTRADAETIGERDRRRAIPRLHQAGMKFVKRLALRVHALVILPRFRDHHHHRVRQFATRQHEQLNAVVEHRGVAAVGVDDGQQLLDVAAELLGDEIVLARVHPIDVAAKRVDLAVVRDEAIRVRTIPAWERVRRETRVNQRQRGSHVRIAQVGKILRHLLGHQHAFIDRRARREARHVKPFAAHHERAVTNPLLGDFADDVKFPLEREIVLDRSIATDKHLHHERLGLLRRRTERRIVRGNIAPAK